jgi:hypothetical protein
VAGGDIAFSHLDWLSSTRIRATLSVSKIAALGRRYRTPVAAARSARACSRSTAARDVGLS